MFIIAYKGRYFLKLYGQMNGRFFTFSLSIIGVEAGSIIIIGAVSITFFGPH